MLGFFMFDVSVPILEVFTKTLGGFCDLTSGSQSAYSPSLIASSSQCLNLAYSIQEKLKDLKYGILLLRDFCSQLCTSTSTSVLSLSLGPPRASLGEQKT